MCHFFNTQAFVFMLKKVTNSDAFLLCILQENNCPLFYFQNSFLISYSVTYLERML